MAACICWLIVEVISRNVRCNNEIHWDGFVKVIAPDFIGSPNCNAIPTDVSAYTTILIYKYFAFSFICIYSK